MVDMKLPRRKFLHLAAGAAALPVLPRAAAALDYPTRPVRLVVGYPAGSGGDIIGRLMGQWLSDHLGQPFVIDDRPGAGTNIATESVVRAQPDGYTLLYVTTANAVNAALYEKLNFNFIRDIAPVARFGSSPLVMEVNLSFPAKTVPEFIAYAKANPGKITMASAGNGTTPHMAGELFKMMTGVNLIHVPYRGAPQAITDLIGGQVQMMFDIVASSIEHIRAGRLRAIGVTTASRLRVLPDVPAIGEFVPGYEAISFGGIGAPQNTAADILDKLDREVNAGLADPTMQARLADFGYIPVSMQRAEFAKLIADETDKWAKVVKFAGIRAE